VQAFNWYSEAGIEVCFLSPHVDGYKTTPAAKVRTGAADVAIAPPETVISSHSPRESWAAPVKLKARPHSSGYLGIILDGTPRAGSAGDVVLCSVRPCTGPRSAASP